MAAVLAQRLGRVRCAIEAVYHRHNVAAILRTCDALGIHHVHLVAGEAGAVSKGPARGAEHWLALHHHASTSEAVAALRAEGFAIWIADLVGAPVIPEAVPVDRPVCLWFGAELLGVSEAAREAADGVVALPMRGMAQSLNVSVAAALALRPVAEAARALGEAAILTDGERAATLAAWLAREGGPSAPGAAAPLPP
jgi:tRNA (guanosine-2'-O-)-methyltransferase